ncbi:MAG TPA: hypothetical protein VNH18_10450, partial [Bryobacteraceae bacterium]|nr:hypothetical protein [Bryobacteraceae bacterium]
MKQTLVIIAFLISFRTPAAYAQATATANVTVGAEAGLTVPTTPVFTAGGGPFGAYAGVTTLTYYIRTSQG